MTPCETIIEAMTRALIWNAWPIPEEETDSDFFDIVKKSNPEWWNFKQQNATTAFNALLAALPDLGLKVVPVDGVPDMNIAGALAWSAELPNSETHVDCAHACYVAMIAAAPDLLGGGE